MSSHKLKNNKNNDNRFLLDHKLPTDSIIVSTINKATKMIADLNINKILVHNKYEKMVPFNLWFRHHLYKISNYFENDQNIRIRYFNSVILTPVVAHDNTNLNSIKIFLANMSLYQPFYPETFFAMWEFLQMRHIDSRSNMFLHIGREERLGSMEAIVFYHEKYQHTYQYNTYHCWLSGKEMFDKLTGHHNMMVPRINYLEQAYKIQFIRSASELTKYDFISIDTIHIFDNVFEWKDEELDLQSILFYILSAIDHLKENGSMIIRLNMIGSYSWSIIFDIVYPLFKEYTFYRPSTINPFNSEIYLFLDKFEHKPLINSLRNRMLKNLYRQKVYQQYYLNTPGNSQNPINQKYIVETKKWAEILAEIIETHKIGAKSTPLEKNSLNHITEWHKSNDLKQIMNLTKEFDDKAAQYVLKTFAKQFTIKPIVPDVLYTKSFYKKLIEKRAELNYYKRVMDTKPSQIFSYNRYNNKRGYLLTWEQLTNQIDTFKNLKYILKREYNAEMVTNAWIKMYEMLNMFPDLLPNSPVVKTFHLCEAPGAFISALNHFVSNRNQKLDWYAQTLKATRIGSDTDWALEDHYGLIATYPNRWIFGDPKIDDSGNITHSNIIKFYANNPLLKNIDFMTADAGLQCEPNELNEQEAFLGKINMGQIICILACLPIGKTAIFKTFLPMSEPLTISMMYLVTHLFASVTIVKPSTSHSLNSEIYVVLRGYKGIEQNMLEVLYAMLDDPKITSKTLVCPQIDMSFFGSYMSSVGLFIDRQIQSLSRNYYYYYNFDQITNFQKITNTYTDDWLRLNPIFMLNNCLANN